MAQQDDPARDPERLLDHVLQRARQHGATDADALFVNGRSSEVRLRLGSVEQVKQSRDRGLGLRVFFGRRQATTSTSDLGEEALEDLVARTCEAAQVTAEDPEAGLPDASLFEEAPRDDLELWDAEVGELDVERAIELARAGEDAARGADPRITNSEGAELGWETNELHLANTRGVHRSRRSSGAAIGVTPVAEAEGGMERDTWVSRARFLSDLDAPASVGEEAARRTVRRLGARKPTTKRVPVIFEAPVACRILGTLARALVGDAIYRETSWLCGHMGETIAASRVTLVDDPHIQRGPASKPFDGEGLATRPRRVVDEGVLSSWLLDTYSARKLGLETTRHASRGLGGKPSASPTNLWMAPGRRSVDELVAEVDEGLFVTELFGFGVNQVTGDYSQGAAGLWIEDGRLTHPVHELTIASTLQAMWPGIDGIADDRDPTRAISAPAFRIDGMTVAGQ